MLPGQLRMSLDFGEVDPALSHNIQKILVGEVGAEEAVEEASIFYWAAKLSS